MADFKFGEYKIVRLFLKRCIGTPIDFDPENTYLDIALKGTKASGLVSKRNSFANKSGLGGLSHSKTSISNS